MTKPERERALAQTCDERETEPASGGDSPADSLRSSAGSGGCPPPTGTTQARMAAIMETVFEECRKLRGAGQLEYAGANRPAFANFERLASDLDMAREKILWVYAMKHRDGIANYLRGHESQREDVRGRINDLIVYLCLLRGMIDEGAA